MRMHGYGIGVATMLIIGACSKDDGKPNAPVPAVAAVASTAPASLPADASGYPELKPANARSELIPAGQAACEFTATDHKGNQLRLGDLLAKQQVVLVFYPADFTSGCTKQLCAVRDDWSKFEQSNAIVLGVNPADVAKHASFADKYQFPFPVVHDKDSQIAAAYGVKGESSTKRAVYVIGRNGKVKLSEFGMVPHDKIFAALQAEGSDKSVLNRETAESVSIS